MRVEPRVAFFPDSFAEVNGVAHTSRQFVAFAEQRNLPLLCVHGGGRTERVLEGAVTNFRSGAETSDSGWRPTSDTTSSSGATRAG